jgi:hypothetical protein
MRRAATGGVTKLNFVAVARELFTMLSWGDRVGLLDVSLEAYIIRWDVSLHEIHRC